MKHKGIKKSVSSIIELTRNMGGQHTMMVGDLISLLEPFRGRGDEVLVWSRYMGEYLRITGVQWDPDEKVVSIETVFLPPPASWDALEEAA